MTFSLYNRPHALVFLDDDASYLETLALIMPRDWNIRLFTHVDDCLLHFEQQRTLWEADVWQQQDIVTQWRAGACVIANMLNYWESKRHRYHLTQTCVVDFAMPAMSGLDFLSKLPLAPANRVLLTGKADEHIAVGAFNDGLIDKFMTKQSPNIGKQLVSLLASLHDKPVDAYESVWRSALKQNQYAILQETTVRQELYALAHERQWVEYVVVPAPFGILALDRHARAHWLQLELRSDLACAADLAQATGQPATVVQKIRSGSHLVNTELLIALKSDEEATFKTTFPIGNTESLLGAFFRVSPDISYGLSHHDFLLTLPPRVVS